MKAIYGILSVLGLLIIWIGLFFYHLNFDVDEERILKETRLAYEKVKFHPAPFSKKDEITDLTDFLSRHLDTLTNYNKHDERRETQLSSGSRTGYINSGSCFTMPTFRDEFVQEYITPGLVDSFYFYLGSLRDTTIIELKICRPGERNSMDPSMESMLLRLNVEKPREAPGSYYLFHYITFNRKIERNDMIDTIYDERGLTKDTTLTDDLRYDILLYPYTGL